MKSVENILIIERVMQKQVPNREVKVTLSITDLCKFIQAARESEQKKIDDQLLDEVYKNNPYKQFDDMFDTPKRGGRPGSKRNNSFSGIFDF